MTTDATHRSDIDDDSGSPVEILVVGCPLAMADGFVNALRNQGQAAHIKLAETTETLDQQLAGERCRVALLNADNSAIPILEALSKLRANNPSASVILIAADPSQHLKMAVDNSVQDIVAVDQESHVALALKREHHAQTLHGDVKRLRRQLGEAEERSNLLVQSSRDAIAYIHEGMYLGCNQAYLDLFGYQQADELEGLPIMDMIDAESRGAFKSALRKLDELGKYNEEFQCVTEDGQNFAAPMEFSPASIDGERCTQVVIRSTLDLQLSRLA